MVKYEKDLESWVGGTRDFSAGHEIRVGTSAAPPWGLLGQIQNL